MAEESKSNDGARRSKPPVAVRSQRRPSKSGWRLFVERLLWLFVLGTIGVVLGVATLVWYYGRDLPSVDSLRNYAPPQVTRILDREGRLIDEIYTERRTVVPLTRVPRVLVLSVLAAEDADFYRHEGLDYPGLLRAVGRSLVTGTRIKGTSTISQQIIKNLILSPERSLARKVRELILARRLEQKYTKDEILSLYLNTINYGHGRYGVEEASLFYFGKHVDALNLAEASLLAGVPQAPTHLSPRTHPEAAHRRQAFVLNQLEQKRAQYWADLSEAEIRRARTQAVAIAPLPEEGENAPEIVSLVRSELTRLVGRDAMARGGFTVHTTIDLNHQRAARQALRTGLTKLDQRRGTHAPLKAPSKRDTKRAQARRAPEILAGRTYDATVIGSNDEAGTLELDVESHRASVRLSEHARFNPQNLPPSRFAERGARVRAFIERVADANEANSVSDAHLDLGPEGAVVLMEPGSRDVLALVGGYQMRAGFNRALSAVRQPGSTFKPIVYAAALRSRRYTPATLVLDAPGVFDRYKPENFETWTSQGAVRLREALAQSINLVAVRVTEDVTPNVVIDLAKQLGITTTLDPSLALALGASDVKPIELVNAYATFAAGGFYEAPRFISRIEGPDHRDVQLPAREARRAVLSPAETYVLTSMLTSVVDHGTATGAQRIGRPCAGKTGTSNDARDAWFIGYTPDVVAGVWVGFDDQRSLGRRESGGKAAVPIWVDLVGAVERNRPAVDFPRPNGVATARIDAATGLLANEGAEGAIDEVFLDGTAPTTYALPIGVVDTATLLMEQQAGSVGSP
jgi:penicillin-binding protein 1A